MSIALTECVSAPARKHSPNAYFRLFSLSLSAVHIAGTFRFRLCRLSAQTARLIVSFVPYCPSIIMSRSGVKQPRAPVQAFSVFYLYLSDERRVIAAPSLSPLLSSRLRRCGLSLEQHSIGKDCSGGFFPPPTVHGVFFQTGAYSATVFARVKQGGGGSPSSSFAQRPCHGGYPAHSLKVVQRPSLSPDKSARMSAVKQCPKKLPPFLTSSSVLYAAFKGKRIRPAAQTRGRIPEARR